MATHKMFGGKLQIVKRGNVWHCHARVEGTRFRKSTGEEDLGPAKEFAEDWYLELRGKSRVGELPNPRSKPTGHLFKEAAEGFLKEYKVLALGNRSDKHIELLEMRLRTHILPIIGARHIRYIDNATIHDYILQRTEKFRERFDRTPARSTLEHDLVAIRHTLNWAMREKWINFVPDVTIPHLKQRKKGRRAWFSPEEYKKLYTATRNRIKTGTRRGWKTHYEDMHDYVLFMANSGLRPDEAKRLEFRDVEIVDDYETGETILVIDVRGKTGVGYAKTMPGAVEPFRRLKARRKYEAKMGQTEKGNCRVLEETDAVFRPFKRHLFNKILTEENLKYDRDGRSRTAYSLRHSYISMRLIEGANIYHIANNCRTSVEVIEKHYAAHIKDRIMTSEINVKRARRLPAR